MREEIKRSLISVDTCYHSAQNFCLPLCYKKYVYDEKYRNIMLFVVSYSCKTLYIILRKDHSLRIFENRALRELFEPERRE
jgi:hypothetical protein